MTTKERKIRTILKPNVGEIRTIIGELVVGGSYKSLRKAM